MNKAFILFLGLLFLNPAFSSEHLPIFKEQQAIEKDSKKFDFSEGIRFGSKAITGPKDELILLRLLKQIARLVGNR